MKKAYTILFLSMTIFAFSQSKSTGDGYHLIQDGDKIEVRKGDSSISNNYTKSGTTGVVQNSGINLPPASSFSSPNEVKITQDAAGNRYWSIIDGTIVKVELAADSPTSNSKQAGGK